MKQSCFAVVVVTAVFAAGSVSAVAAQDETGQLSSSGEDLFQTRCAVCHTIGAGRLVGPDLRGVSERRSEEWIISFVQHSQQMVAAGDPDAVAIFEEYNQIMMPDQALFDEEILAIIGYIRTAETASAQPVAPREATEEQILLGQQLFQGRVRFANGGPTCNSCHEVAHGAVLGGGVLARDLTAAHSRLGAAGVRAVLASPPFPVMQRAYQGKPLTDEEVVALAAFLQRADEEQALSQPIPYGRNLLLAGVAGTAILLGLYSLLWRGRLKGSVNQPIFDRQVRSS